MTDHDGDRPDGAAGTREPHVEKRWPASVYAQGQEPDPRFSLANERTFLAWIRTTLALLAAAAAVDALDLPMPDRLQRAIAVLLALVALFAGVQAWLGWARTERAMRANRPLPSTRASLPIAIAVSVVALALAIVSLVRG